MFKYENRNNVFEFDDLLQFLIDVLKISYFKKNRIVNGESPFRLTKSYLIMMKYLFLDNNDSQVLFFSTGFYCENVFLKKGRVVYIFQLISGNIT